MCVFLLISAMTLWVSPHRRHTQKCFVFFFFPLLGWVSDNREAPKELNNAKFPQLSRRYSPNMFIKRPHTKYKTHTKELVGWASESGSPQNRKKTKNKKTSYGTLATDRSVDVEGRHENAKLPSDNNNNKKFTKRRRRRRHCMEKRM